MSTGQSESGMPREDLGPFEDINRMGRKDIVRLLEGASIQCYDHESTEELREALRANYDDGTISAEDISAVSP